MATLASLISVALCFAGMTFSAQAAELNKNIATPDLIPWNLPFHVKEALSQDVHLDHLKISPDNAKIALVGSFAWVWQPNSGDLRRVTLPDAKPTNTLVGVEWLDNNRLLIVEEFGFSEFNLISGHISQRFAFKSKQPSPLLGFQVTEQHLHFFTSQHVMSFTRDLSSHRNTTFAKTALPKSARVVMTGEGSDLWWTVDRSLYHSWQNGERREKKLVFKGEDALLQLSAHGDAVAITTPKSTLIFGNDNKLRQAIPVISQRRIVAANTTGTHHTYLYQDGLIDIIRMPDGFRRSAKIDYDAKNSVTDITASADKIAYIQNGMVQMWRWQDTKAPIVSLESQEPPKGKAKL